jgi:hypothetical protein
MSTVTINGNTWTTQTLPSTPAAPTSMEFAQNAIVASSNNPFTSQQQMFDWGVTYKEVSISYGTMTSTTAQAWLTFIESLRGPKCVFCFGSTVCAMYPNELTTDGTAPRYFRLKTNSVKWAVAPGGVYTGFTFECREVI